VHDGDGVEQSHTNHNENQKQHNQKQAVALNHPMAEGLDPRVFRVSPGYQSAGSSGVIIGVPAELDEFLNNRSPRIVPNSAKKKLDGADQVPGPQLVTSAVEKLREVELVIPKPGFLKKVTNVVKGEFGLKVGIYY
jgi:hypothetical protein